MTINSEIRRAGPFTGNGVTTRFPFDFKVFRAEDLYVVVAPAEGDGELPLHLGTDYTVELNPDQNATPGGEIIAPVALPVGFTLTATSALDYLQPIDLTNQGGFYPRVINDGLDRLTIFVQQLNEGLERSLKVPLSDGRTPQEYWGSRFDKAEENATAAAQSADEAKDYRDSTQVIADKFGDVDSAVSQTEALRNETAGLTAIAESSAASAEVDADRADTAANAAFINADVYPDVAAGLAAVADGEQFQVVEGDEIVRYRRDSVSTQTEVARYPSSEKIEAEISERKALITSARNSVVAGHRVAMAEVDEAGHVAYAVDEEGNRLLWAAIRFMRAGFTVSGSESGLTFEKGGVAVFEMLSDGSIRTERLRERSGADPRYSAAWTDDAGAVALWIDRLGRVGFTPAPKILDGYLDDYIFRSDALSDLIATSQAGEAKRQTLVADVCHILVSGQSLSVGVASTPGLTTVQPYDNIMPSVGVIDGEVNNQGPTSGPVSTSFAPLTFVSQNANLGETVGIGGANFAKHLANEDRPGNTIQFLVSNNGYGGRPISELSKGGGPYYGYGIGQCELYRARANSDDKTYVLQAVWWLQGETDSTNNLPRDDYKAALTKLISDINADLPQRLRAPLLTYQMASHTKRGTGRPPEIALAQLEASREHKDIYLVTPTYHLTYTGDGVHLTAHSTRWLGQYFGKVHKKICIDGEHWRPVEPIRTTQQGRIVDLTFHVPHRPLVLDTVRVTDPGDYGFEVLDQSGNLLTIESVAIASEDRVRIVLQDPQTEPVRVRYAYGEDGWQTGPSSGARGCLRDSDDTSSMYNNASDQPYELYNWCVIFNELAEII